MAKSKRKKRKNKKRLAGIKEFSTNDNVMVENQNQQNDTRIHNIKMDISPSINYQMVPLPNFSHSSINQNPTKIIEKEWAHWITN